MSNKKKLIGGSIGLGALGAIGTGLGIVANENKSNIQKLEEQNIEIASLKKQLEAKNSESNLLLQEIGALNDSVDSLMARNVDHAGFYKKQSEQLYGELQQIKGQHKDIESLEEELEDMKEMDVVGHTMQCLLQVWNTGKLPNQLPEVENTGDNWVVHHNTGVFNNIQHSFNQDDRDEIEQKRWDSKMACSAWAMAKVFSKISFHTLEKNTSH